VEMSESQVAEAVHTLERKQLIKQAPPSAGARANRFGHNIVDRVQWDRREQAVMAELMLRGRQTAGELRTRATRMTPLNDLEVVGQILAGLARRDTPVVRELPREPGRSANRWQHLLSGEAAAEPMPPARTSVVEQAPMADVPAEPDRLELLEARLAALEERVTRLGG